MAQTRLFSLVSNGRILVLNRPVVMGILNITPDSFYENSRVSLDELVHRAGEMISEGARILDLGGQSTRPGAVQVGPEVEASRVIPAIEAVKKAHPETWISIDTYHAAVAKMAVEAGADIVNDISAGDDDERMLQTIAQLGLPYIAMHKLGAAGNMPAEPEYEDVVLDVLNYFIEKKNQLESKGIFNWILDPGFGFGKNLNQNVKLLAHLSTFQILNQPILVGISRKKMIQRLFDVDVSNALNGTTAMHMVALQNGATILRVHDVKEAMQCIQAYLATQSVV